IEPRDVASKSYTPNPGFNGSNTTIINNTTNNYNADAGNNVSVWPVVLNLFSPFFIPWHSPWRWGYYPSYWRPWRPVYYHDYWGYNRRFTNYYYRTNVIRTPYYRSYYANRRMYSAIVRNNRINGLYRSTYNGRVYKKPVYPGLRPNGSNRPGVNRPVTLPSNKYPNRPVGGNSSLNRPTTLPSNKYPNRPVGGNNGVNRPTTLPSNKYPNRPVGGNNGANRPTTFPSTKYPAANRPVSPSTRPSTPTTFPSTRPANNPMTRPTSRPANYPMARPAARPRATPVGRGTSPNRSGSRSNN
ncbi:MAG: hypothetical protein ACRC6O_00745, partial [Flavobacterium sp.]